MIGGEFLTGRDPALLRVLRFFDYDHLPPHLRLVSAMFADLAERLVRATSDGDELLVAVRKLLEAKDAAVRHVLVTMPPHHEDDEAPR